jgi:hypothetical protein
VGLTQVQIDYMAQRAYWQFYLQENYREARGYDPVMITGDGVDDLNQLIARIENWGTQFTRVMCDVGSAFSVYKESSVSDVYALRTAYISVWGTVNKPDYWDSTQPGV